MPQIPSLNQVIQPGDFTRVPPHPAAHARSRSWRVPGQRTRRARRMSVTDVRNPLATALGSYYPRGYVVAVIHDPASATNALAALQREGFVDTAAAICPGPEFVKNWSDFTAHRGPL